MSMFDLILGILLIWIGYKLDQQEKEIKNIKKHYSQFRDED